MAYSGYGAFVFLNGKRRQDKEDVGVFDTDESNVPTGLRIYENLLKNGIEGSSPWWKHSQHGVLGDGNVRVACFKCGAPSIWYWEEGCNEPVQFNIDKYLYTKTRTVQKNDGTEVIETALDTNDYEVEFKVKLCGKDYEFIFRGTNCTEPWSMSSSGTREFWERGRLRHKFVDFIYALRRPLYRWGRFGYNLWDKLSWLVYSRVERLEAVGCFGTCQYEAEMIERSGELVSVWESAYGVSYGAGYMDEYGIAYDSKWRRLRKLHAKLFRKPYDFIQLRFDRVSIHNL